MQILWGLFGIFVILGIAVLASRNRKAINIRTVLGALIIQIGFAFAVLKWETGRLVFQKITAFVQTIIDSSNEGIQFLFGGVLSEDAVIFAFQVLTVVIFFSSLISVLYYLGVMQFLIKIIGGFLSRILKTTRPGV